jgi:hypothetical protein
LAFDVFFATGRNFGINRPFASCARHYLQEVSEKTVSMAAATQPDTSRRYVYVHNRCLQNQQSRLNWLLIPKPLQTDASPLRAGTSYKRLQSLIKWEMRPQPRRGQVRTLKKTPAENMISNALNSAFCRHSTS